MNQFKSFNRGFQHVFTPGQLSLGLVVPIERYVSSPVATMKDHMQRIRLAEELGFKAIWVRDIPLNVPSFGDAGQGFDPFTYLGFVAAQTSEIALATGSIALPLHHPVHVAKAAATIDQLSEGRMILGVASGDRPSEFPAMGIEFERRGELFRDAFMTTKAAQEEFPQRPANSFGELTGGIDILPKPFGTEIPMLITGGSRQSLEWNAEHADGWMSYPKNVGQQRYTLSHWRKLVKEFHPFDKPFMQPLYVDLQEDDDFKPVPIHLGFMIGANYLAEYLHLLKESGVNHVGLNLRFNSLGAEATMEHLANKVLPHFHQPTSQTAST